MVVTNRAELISFDLNSCNDKDLDFKSSFELKSSGENNEVKIDKLVVSFDVDFDLLPDKECTAVSFSTSCQMTPTHWKQTSLWFDPEGAPTIQTGEVMRGTFSMNRNDVNQRDMDFVVTWEVGLDETVFKPRVQGTILSRLSS